MKARYGTVFFSVLLSLAVAPTADAATITFSNRAAFDAATGVQIVDPYTAAGYASGDVQDSLISDTFSDAAMTAVLGETAYTTTGRANFNIVADTFPPDRAYCSGCNGSFELDFTSTSIGSSTGVYGVGIDVLVNHATVPYVAFVTFGDGSTTNFALAPASIPTRYFWGVTSDLLIRTIDFGLANGGTTQDGNFFIDNLTISAAAAPVPEPATLSLFGLGLAGVVARRRMKRR